MERFGLPVTESSWNSGSEGLPMSINKEYKKSKAELRKVAVFKGQTEK